MARYRLRANVYPQLREIWRFIARANPVAADEVIDAVYETFQFLAENPKVGTRQNFSRLKQEIRSWPVQGYGRYVVFYTHTSGGTVIVRVAHSARDIKSLFNPAGPY